MALIVIMRKSYIEIRMKKVYVYILIFIVTFISIIYFSIGTDNQCENIRNIAENIEVRQAIKKQFFNIMEDPILLESSNKRVGKIYVKNQNNFYGFDWDEINIPIKYATIEFSGKGVDYAAFDKSKVDSFVLGYGYRKLIVFSKDDEIDLVNVYPYNLSKDITKISKGIYISCNGLITN